MPLLLGEEGRRYKVVKVGGNPDTKQFLGNLGFCQDAVIMIVSKVGENMIVKLLDSRIALSKEMAGKIVVTEVS